MEVDILAWIVRIIVFLVAFWIFRFVKSFIKVSPKGKAVLITGCDSGFGLLTSKKLAIEGFKVFSGCLTQSGVDNLSKHKNIIPFIMNVTDENSVQEAVNFVESQLETDVLWGLINNAGLLRSGDMDVMSIQNWNIQLNVNVVGMAITSKYFFPLLMKGKGRIVNIASVAGRFGTPSTSAYNASKYAVEGLSDAWRRELKRWGIKVIIVEPGIMKTPLWDAPLNEAHIDQVWNTLNDEQKERYGRDYFINSEKIGRELINKFGGDPSLVVNTLKQTIMEMFPNSRYAVGLDCLIWIGLSYFPTFISDAIVPLILKPATPAYFQAVGNKKHN